MKMKPGFIQVPGIPSRLTEGERQVLEDRLQQSRSFQKTVKQIRARYGITVAKSKRLWKPIRKFLNRPGFVELKLPSPDIQTVFRKQRGRHREMLLRWAFFWPTVPGHDLDTRINLLLPEKPFEGLSRAEALRFYQQASSHPAVTRHPLRKALEEWVRYYIQVQAKDIEDLRATTQLPHVWNLLLMDYLLFGGSLLDLATFSPKPGVEPYWSDRRGEGELFVWVFKNTGLREVRRARRTLTHWAKWLRDSSAQKPRIKVLQDRISIGPLPKKGPAEAIEALWPQVMKAQGKLDGLGDFRERPYYMRALENERLRKQGFSYKKIKEHLPGTNLPEYPSELAAKQENYRTKQRRK